tara:strand:+ start:525 stop:743 length:219 start_codon:yes stop_codon:yes gene_type:complete
MIKDKLYDEVEKIDECHNPHDQKASASQNHFQEPIEPVMQIEIETHNFKLPKSHTAEALIARGISWVYQSVI